MEKRCREPLLCGYYGRQNLYDGKTVFEGDDEFVKVEVVQRDSVAGPSVWVTRTTCYPEDEEADEQLSKEYKQFYTVSPVIKRSRYILSDSYPIAILSYIEKDHYKLCGNCAYGQVFLNHKFDKDWHGEGFPDVMPPELVMDIKRTANRMEFYAFDDLIAEITITKADSTKRPAYDEDYDNLIKVSMTKAAECIAAFAIFPMHDLLFTPDPYDLTDEGFAEPCEREDTYDDGLMFVNLAGYDMIRHICELKVMTGTVRNGSDTLVWDFEPVDPERCLTEPYYEPYDEYSLMSMSPDKLKTLYETEQTRRRLLGMDLKELKEEFSSLLTEDRQLYFDIE